MRSCSMSRIFRAALWLASLVVLAQALPLATVAARTRKKSSRRSRTRADATKKKSEAEYYGLYKVFADTM